MPKVNQVFEQRDVEVLCQLIGDCSEPHKIGKGIFDFLHPYKGKVVDEFDFVTGLYTAFLKAGFKPVSNHSELYTAILAHYTTGKYVTPTKTQFLNLLNQPTTSG